jgi:hypothetical protein
MKVAALCVAANSVYKTLPDVDAFDKRRDVRTFTGGMSVVAHPPCGPWSAYVSHQAKAPADQRELGPLCVEWLRREGGVLEHPAHSGLFTACTLPMPGQRLGDLFTVEVWQAWWGYPMRKATWLCVAGVDMRTVEFPHCDHDSRAGLGDRRRQQVMSHNQRAATCLPFARWLVDLARRVRMPQEVAA